MKNRPYVGVWLDHREAFLFWVDAEADIHELHVKSQYQEEGEPADRAPGVQPGGVSHASIERRQKEQLNHYYKWLAKTLHSAEEIFLFGPGMAKKELAGAIEERKDMNGRLKAVESADNMTKRQMAARVREFFQLPRTAV